MKYVKGILGGLIGGIIGALPWILVYVYANYLLSLLATVIAFGIAFGYKLFKGPKTKSYPVIVAVLSVLIVVITTLVIIPLVELAHEGITANFDVLKLLYSNSEFVTSIMSDLAISIIFTIIGIASVINKTKQEIDNEDNETTKTIAKA